MILCAGRDENGACKSPAFITPLLSGFECCDRLCIPGLSLHILTSSEMTSLQPASQGIVSKPTPTEKPSLSRISIAYVHQSILKLSTGWFETCDNDRRGDLFYPNVVLYLMRQGLHLESIIFRCPVHLPQSKRRFSFQIHGIRPQNWSTELTCSLCRRGCPEAASILFPFTTARWQLQTWQLTTWEKSHLILQGIWGFQHWLH